MVYMFLAGPLFKSVLLHYNAVRVGVWTVEIMYFLQQQHYGAIVVNSNIISYSIKPITFGNKDFATEENYSVVEFA